MWYTFPFKSLTDILPFDDHTLLSRPRRHSCLHKYISLSRNMVMSSLILTFFVSLWERSFFRSFRIPNFVTTDFSLVIICRYKISRFSNSVGIYNVIRRELDPGLGCGIDTFGFCVFSWRFRNAEIRIRGLPPYGSSSSNCILSCLFSSRSLSTWIHNGLTFLAIICDISSRRDSLTTTLTPSAFFYLSSADIVTG